MRFTESNMRVIILSISLMLALGPNAWAQWDLRGCADRGVNTAYPETIESSLWTFRSTVWDGYIDFQEGGKYWTHWGAGKWTVRPDGGLHLANDYNDRTYEIYFYDNGFRYQGARSDGLQVSGRLICAQYQGPGPQVDPKVEETLITTFKDVMERRPFDKELEDLKRKHLQGVSMENIKEYLKTFPEYQQKEAARQEYLRLHPPPPDPY